MDKNTQRRTCIQEWEINFQRENRYLLKDGTIGSFSFKGFSRLAGEAFFIGQMFIKIRRGVCVYGR